MTDDDRLSALLRAALDPTPEDEARSARLVDAVVSGRRARDRRQGRSAGGADTEGHPTGTVAGSPGGRRDEVPPTPLRSAPAGRPARGSRTIPWVAVAAALLLAVGVALPSILRHHEAPPAVAGLARLDGTRFVDTETWLYDTFPTMSWASTDFVRPPLVAVRTAPWCPACGGREFLSRVTASAKARPDTRFVVLVPGATVSDLAAADVPGNVHVLPASKDTPLPGEDASSVSETPVATRLSPASALTAVARGARAVDELLAPPPATQVLTVRCTDTETQVDARTVAAASDGVHLRVIDTGTRPTAAMMSEVPDIEGWPGVGPGGSVDLVLPAAPGRHTITCHEKGAAATVEVTDPTSSWRGTIAQAAPSCREGVIADYAGGPGRGRTPRDAVLAWPSREFGPKVTPLAEEPGVTVRPLAAGYLDADQWWVAERDGRPQTVLRVSSDRPGGQDDRGAPRHRAEPVRPCGL